MDVLERAGVPYALMGGLASAAIGRRRFTRDVDLFVTPGDADAALTSLARAGFRVERTDPDWLYKAFRGGVMVDVIFVSKRGIVFDHEMRAHCRPVEIRGRPILALSPEDLIVIKAVATAEHVPRHWHDALGLLAGADLDWPCLVRRAAPHAARVAACCCTRCRTGCRRRASRCASCSRQRCAPSTTPPNTEAEHHVAARLRQALATDPRVHELHVAVAVSDHDVVVRGQVATPDRRRAVDAVVRELAGGRRVRNEVEVT